MSCQSGCPMPECPPPENCPPCPSAGASNGNGAAKRNGCQPEPASSTCGAQSRPYYSNPPDCKYDPKYDLDQKEPIELTSGEESWCNYGLRILFTNPPTPVDVTPKEGCPIPMTLCVQLRNEACINPECITAYCRSNIATSENPEGDLADFCMNFNMCLSEYECLTQTHMYQLCLVPTAEENKDIKFKIEYMNVTVWAEDSSEENKKSNGNRGSVGSGKSGNGKKL